MTEARAAELLRCTIEGREPEAVARWLGGALSALLRGEADKLGHALGLPGTALRAALASERERARAVSYGLQDAAAGAVARLADDLADGCAALAERHTAGRLRRAVASGALAWLINREAARCGLYGLADALGKVGRSNDRPTFDDDA